MVAPRRALLHLHRWAGLAMAAFLTLAGLTGSVIAFQGELDAWLNPMLFHAHAKGPPLSLDQLAERLNAQDPRAEINYIAFRVGPGESIPTFIRPRPDPAGGNPPVLDFNEVFLDPATGSVLGRRLWGACCFASDRLLPFLYRFHYTLAAGEAGEWLMGSIAILWALDCFIGLSLTFPRGRPFLGKWRIAWAIKRHAGGHRLTLDLHRAVGLWLWFLLLLMAITGVALALQEEVFRPALGSVMELTPSPFELARGRPTPVSGRTRIGLDRAVAIAAAESERRGWGIAPSAVFNAAMFSTYTVYFFPSPTDRGAGLGRPVIYLDDSSGDILQVDVPGEGKAGDAVLSFQFPFHSGQILGLPGRIAISVLGLTVATLSVTGVLVWARKRRARCRLARRRPDCHPVAPHLANACWSHRAAYYCSRSRRKRRAVQPIHGGDGSS